MSLGKLNGIARFSVYNRTPCHCLAATLHHTEADTLCTCIHTTTYNHREDRDERWTRMETGALGVDLVRVNSSRPVNKEGC